MMQKGLWVTVDYCDDALRAGRLYSREDLDAMMAYAASLGASWVQWIVDTKWTFYDDDNPHGFDLLAVACEAAHRHGLKFAAVFKPFEGGSGGAYLLPTGLPIPDDAPVLHELEGILHTFRDAVARYPEAALARAPDDAVDPGGRIAAVRLVHRNDAPDPFGPDGLSLWTSPRNGGYTRYAGPLRFTDRIEWRYRFPYPDAPCRIVGLEDLELPQETRFLLLRRERDGAPFSHAVEQCVELVNDRGGGIPCTPALRCIDGNATFERFRRLVELGASRFARRPEARALLNDREGFVAHCEGMRQFNAGWEEVTLKAAGDELVVARGKVRKRTGNLHPIYPEVRRSWLDEVRFCIARGVDAVNIRAANHDQVYEPRFYGFNPPVVERMTHPGNFAEAERINGDAYTEFLREAAALLHDAGRKIGVHVHGLMLRHADRAPNINMFPLNFEWQWETWLREFADYAEYRGAFFFRPENQRYATDRIGLVAREAGVPLVYQSLRGVMMHFDGPYPALAHEMDWVRNHPDVAAYNLYEMANFSRCKPETGFEGSCDMADLVRKHWHEQGE